MKMKSQRHRRVGIAGFTLIELAVAMVIMGLIAVVVVRLLPTLTDRIRLDDTAAELGALQDTIDGFALDNHRLPCPDGDGDGDEDCGNSVGGMPWQTLGLPRLSRDTALRPIRYGAYRDTTDLTALSALFTPNLPDDLDITPGTVTGCDTEGDYTLVSFKSEDYTTFELNSSAGFEVGEYVGLGIMDYSNIITNSTANPCPCGGINGISCTACTAFPDDTYVVGNTSGDVARVASTTTTGNPGQFHSYFPGGSFAPPETLEGQDGSGTPIGVTATATSFTSLIAQVIEIDGSDLKVEILESITSNSNFGVGDPVTGDVSSATATVTSITGTVISADVSGGIFQSGESVNGGTGEVSSLAPASFSANVTGGSPAVGDTLTGTTAGDTSTVQGVFDRSIEFSVDSGFVVVGDTVSGTTASDTALVTSVLGLTAEAVIGGGAFAPGDPVTFSGGTGTVTSVLTQLNATVDGGTFSVGEAVSGGGTSAVVTTSTPTASITIVDNSATGNVDFAAGMEIHGSSSGAREVIQGIVPPSGVNFAGGDTVTDGSATGTVITGGAGDNWVLLDSVSGTFTVGNTLRPNGGTPPPGGEIVAVNDDATAIPTASAGSITRTASDNSAVLNRLDFCQGLRDAHTATVFGANPSTDAVNTNDPSTRRINPAYLLVSGGVEDADGDSADFSFDRLNELATTDALDFNSPATGRRADYDDVVTAMPMMQLEQRLQCGRNIGAVNAKAASATAMKNNALTAFYLNEQAILSVQVNYQAWQMAIVDRDIARVQLAIDIVSTAIDLYRIIMYTEGQTAAQAIKSVDFILAAISGIGGVITDIATLVTETESAVAEAETDFEESCQAQLDALAELGSADIAADVELQEAIRIDQLGGVK